MKSFGGFPVPIPLSTKMPLGKVMSRKLGNGLFVEMSTRNGRKRRSHFFGSMALLAVVKPFCRRFSVPATVRMYNIDVT